MPGGEDKNFHHRSGALSQKNKAFKGGSGGGLRQRKSTSSRDGGRKVKVGGGSIMRAVKPKGAGGGPETTGEARNSRRNASRQKQQMKREATIVRRRLGTFGSPPKCVCIVSLTSDTDCDEILKVLSGNEEPIVPTGMPLPLQLSDHQHTRLNVIVPPRNLMFELDAILIADVVIWLIAVDGEIDPHGDELLTAVRAQGLPLSVAVAQGGSKVMHKQNRFSAMKLCSRIIHTELGNETKTVSVDNDMDKNKFVRFISNSVPKQLHSRERPFLLAESFDFTSDTSDLAGNEDGGDVIGTLSLTGWLRGELPLSVNNIAHIVGAGSFSVKRVVNVSKPRKSKRSRCSSSTTATDEMMEDDNEEEEEEEGDVVQVSNANKDKADVIEEENPDAFDEFPTEEDVLEAERERKLALNRVTSKLTARGDVIDGYDPISDEHDDEEENEYQMDWLPKGEMAAFEGGDAADDEMMMEGDDENDDDENDENDENDDDSLDGNVSNNDDDDDTKLTVPDPSARMTSEDILRAEQSRRAEAEWREKEEEKEAQRDDDEFPDELDTPIDEFAHVRFARYRGLRSLRKATWDPNEALPSTYGRIFRLADFKGTEKAEFAAAEENPIQPGHQVTIEFAHFPLNLLEFWKDLNSQAVASGGCCLGIPLIVVSLLPNEQRLSVSHVAVTPTPAATRSVDSKSGQELLVESPLHSRSPLIVQVGWRRYLVRPVLSVDTSTPAVNRTSVVKMERYMHPNRRTVLSFYAPIHFGAAPVLVYRPPESMNVTDSIFSSATSIWANKADVNLSSSELVATGSFLGVNPDRVVVKRVVLSGYPVKIYKKTCIIRYMFFHPEDVKWFKPIELWTKYGRRGHIVEPMGTHGRMRCRFDARMKSQDTVCMALYKRIYPKWGCQLVGWGNMAPR